MIRRLPRVLLAAPLVAAAIAAGCGGGSTAPEAAPTGVPEPAPAPPAEPPPAAPVECVPEEVPFQALPDGGSHVEELPAGFEYNSVPASQGPHHPQWLIWNWYEVEVPELNKVHNLEHGGIAVQWGPEVSAETIAAIRAWYEDDPNGIVAAPHPGLGSRVALTAWYSDRSAATQEQLYAESTGRLLTCTGFDDAAFSEFRESYRGQGPEPFPVRFLRPGTDGTG